MKPINKLKTLNQIIDKLVSLREELKDGDLDVFLYDYRYEVYCNIDEIEYYKATETIKIK